MWETLFAFSKLRFAYRLDVMSGICFTNRMQTLIMQCHCELIVDSKEMEKLYHVNYSELQQWCELNRLERANANGFNIKFLRSIHRYGGRTRTEREQRKMTINQK